MHDIHIAGPRRSTSGRGSYTTLQMRASRTAMSITIGRHPAEIRLEREAATDPDKAYMLTRLGEIRERSPLIPFEGAMLLLAASLPRRIRPSVIVERPEEMPC